MTWGEWNTVKESEHVQVDSVDKNLPPLEPSRPTALVALHSATDHMANSLPQEKCTCHLKQSKQQIGQFQHPW